MNTQENGIKLHPELSIIYCRAMKLVSHVPPQPRAELGAMLRNTLYNFTRGMEWIPPVPTKTEEASNGTV